MKLLYVTLRETAMGNHYAYATYQGESGNIFSPRDPFVPGERTKERMLAKLTHYNVRVVKG